MDQLKSFLLILYIFNGLLMAVAGLPLLRRKIGPNRLYGFRVARTLNDPAVWYEANAFAGRCLVWTGLATVVGTIGLVLVPGIDGVTFALACLSIVAVGLTVTIVLTFRLLDRLVGR